MTQNDLDLVVSATNHERFRVLTNPSHPAYNAGYIQVVSDMAARIRGEKVSAKEEEARVLAAIAACPSRGNVLPVSRQPECGCAELSECFAGKGKRPGEVTLGECVACKG